MTSRGAPFRTGTDGKALLPLVSPGQPKPGKQNLIYADAHLRGDRGRVRLLERGLLAQAFEIGIYPEAVRVQRWDRDLGPSCMPRPDVFGSLSLDQNLLKSLALPPHIINDGKFEGVCTRSSRAEIQLLASTGSQSINLILESDHQRFGLG